MEKNHNKLSTELENLLLAKSYDQLNASEKAKVQAQLSQQEYAAFRAVLLESKQVFAASKKHPAPAMPLRLKQMVRNKKDKSPFWTWLHWLMNYPLPTWQPALGMLAILAFFFSPLSPSAKPVKNSEPVYVYKVDTVYRNITDTIYREKPASETAQMDEQTKQPSKSTVSISKKGKSQLAKATKNIKQHRVSTRPNPQQQKVDNSSGELLALNVDSTVFNQKEPFQMRRDSGHSLNEVSGIMDFFVEIN